MGLHTLRSSTLSRPESSTHKSTGVRTPEAPKACSPWPVSKPLTLSVYGFLSFETPDVTITWAHAQLNYRFYTGQSLLHHTLRTWTQIQATEERLADQEPLQHLNESTGKGFESSLCMLFCFSHLFSWLGRDGSARPEAQTPKTRHPRASSLELVAT